MEDFVMSQEVLALFAEEVNTPIREKYTFMSVGGGLGGCPISLMFLYKLLVFGHRSLTKNIPQIAVINILKTKLTSILNLTFRLLVNIYFQKYDRYNF